MECTAVTRLCKICGRATLTNLLTSHGRSHHFCTCVGCLHAGKKNVPLDNNMVNKVQGTLFSIHMGKPSLKMLRMKAEAAHFGNIIGKDEQSVHAALSQCANGNSALSPTHLHSRMTNRTDDKLQPNSCRFKTIPSMMHIWPFVLLLICHTA